jgi:hypothetical protein
MDRGTAQGDEEGGESDPAERGMTELGKAQSEQRTREDR